MKRPPRARFHCKHYSYDRKRWPEKGGPKCALGIDLSEPLSFNCCMPDPKAPCPSREDWTAEERAAWDAWVSHGITALGVALNAMEPVAVGFRNTIPCPNCDGLFTVERIEQSAYVSCSNPECVGPAHFNLGHRDPWPSKVEESDA